MDQWSHMDFENLIQGVLSGEYNIQEPLIIHNVAGDRVNKQSFLNYLMNYENINKDNFLRALHDIFNTLQKRIYKLKSNPNINRMIIRIHDEWIEPEKDFVLIKSISPEIIDVKHVIDKEYGKSCEFCDNAEKTCQVLRSSPIDEINKSNNVDRETEWAIMLCDELSNKIQSTMEDVKNYINQTKSYDLSLLIDLSIKHKSLYLKLNDVQDDEIPENIHTIFSNYIYMFNLFHKQLIQYHHSLELLLEDLQNRCKKIKTLKNEFGMVAQVDLDKLLGQGKNLILDEQPVKQLQPQLSKMDKKINEITDEDLFNQSSDDSDFTSSEEEEEEEECINGGGEDENYKNVEEPGHDLFSFF
mgnify:CR=1 FL=1|tara:strand:+ start:79 stop:1149 length:1071 start_codon:yes stop_codon:yes gene_type:complete